MRMQWLSGSLFVPQESRGMRLTLTLATGEGAVRAVPGRCSVLIDILPRLN